MQGLYNKDSELVAYHYQNMILHPESLTVLGLVLGNCLFNRGAVIIGKLFREKVFLLSGEVIASESDATLPVPELLNFNNCLAGAWQILVLVKDHDSPWIEPNGKWAKDPFTHFLH